MATRSFRIRLLLWLIMALGLVVTVVTTGTEYRLIGLALIATCGGAFLFLPSCVLCGSYRVTYHEDRCAGIAGCGHHWYICRRCGHSQLYDRDGYPLSPKNPFVGYGGPADSSGGSTL